MSYSDSLIHFLTKEPPPKGSKAEQSALIDQQIREWEAKGNKVVTTSIEKRYLVKMTNKQNINRLKRQRDWGNKGVVVK